MDCGCHSGLTGQCGRDMVCALLPTSLVSQSMRRIRVPFALAGTLAVAYFLTACDNFVDQHGFAATPGSVDKIEIGTQSREDVVRLIGSPSAVATFNPNVWYYISQRQETFAFFKAQLVDQKVMQLTFNDAGRLEAIKKYDLNDAEHITMVSRITPTVGKELTVLEQILGNVGRFAAPGQSNTGPIGAPTSGGGV
jgi:outer membrane protein assembly factor BamE (lipoprotein component of BamABCDE complex)